ncbi:hypothetical protein TD95_000310 [Thielaviopsis punctulata]|uniref:non-specific serine/threonine protein kinase n=1 Tax=Thielaviopsis punctulata TaxID=72032 RepID=A0A0F4ZFF7_9PEZI|nr:hypothetical protein TD95_000310 [Thielaviopsis punctulata]
MSLIPYSSSEGREIVLRHRNAIVVRDPTSQRLDIRLLTECPTCHQSLHPPSPDHTFDTSPSGRHESYVNPEYFRMLRSGSYYDRSHDRHSSSGGVNHSPIRRLAPNLLPRGIPSSGAVADNVEDMVPAHSEQAAQRSSGPGSRIKREAFSPNYFKTFFVEEKVLGKGGKGVVLLVRHQIDGCHFACKRVPVGDDHAWLEKVLVEVELLAKLSHPNLVSYRHVWLEDVQLTMFGPSVACAFILQQYCNGGDLLNYVVGSAPIEATKEDLKARMRRRSRGHSEPPKNLKRKLPLEEIYSLFKDVTSGLVYLHANNYIHRDLKPSNCLLHHDGGIATCLISDFGEVQVQNVARKSTGSTGTISYCAPEVLRQDSTGHYGNFTTKSDIFSLGMILYFMCFGRLPYQNSNAVQEELENIDLLREEILHWEGFREERRERPDLPFQLYQLLQTLLALDPANRPSAAEVLAAIKNESQFDTVSRKTPPLGLRRVQPLDTPGRSGISTPAEPSRKSSTSPKPTVFSNGTTNPFAPPSGTRSTAREHNELESPRLRSHAMTLSRNSESLAAQAKQHQEVVAHDRAIQRSPTRRSMSIGDESILSHSHVPLLMPPPLPAPNNSSLWRFILRIVAIDNFVHLHSELSIIVLRWAVFVGKVTYLIQPCAPYLPRSKIVLPLVGLAGLNMALPFSTELANRNADLMLRGQTPRVMWKPTTEVVFLVVHLLVVWWTRRAGVLCVAPFAI